MELLYLMTLVYIYLAHHGGVLPIVCPKQCSCTESFKKINCRNAGLTSIPDNFPNTALQIILDNNALSFIPAKAFIGVPKLQRLSMKSCSIDSIEVQAFSGLGDLQYLVMTGNQISSLKNDVLQPLQSLQYLLMGQNRLMQVPDVGVLANLKKIGLEGNRIMQLRIPAGFLKLTKLSTIIVSNNQIASVRKNDIANLTNCGIQVLEFSRAQLKNVEPGTFTVLRKLKSLKLAYNLFNITVLQSIIKDLSGSAILSLNIGGLKEMAHSILPPKLFEPLNSTKLKTLSLSHTPLLRISPDLFVPLPYLSYLDLDNCRLLVVLNAFQHLTNLLSLRLNHNQLINVPQSLPTSLKWLSLASNRISMIDDQAFVHLKALTFLTLQNNVIVKLRGGAFAGLEMVDYLDLSDNKIDGAAILTFSPLRKLKKFLLHNNRFKLPTNKLFEKLQSLEYFDFSGNRCPNIPPGSFANLNKLKFLNLENNEIGHSLALDIDGQVFNGLSAIESLNLNLNGLTIIPDHLFDGLKNLTTLKVSNNYITYWGNDAFKQNKQLKTIDFSHNSISIINALSMSFLKTQLKSMDLTDNPFTCTCDLVWFRNWFTTSNISFPNIEKYTCKSPPSYNGKRLLDFDPSSIDCMDHTLEIATSSAAGGVFILLVIIIIFYRYRWFLKLRIHRVRKRLNVDVEYEPIVGECLKWDAYLSYCSKSDMSIRWIVNELLPKCDNGDNHAGQFKLCFAERDFEVGMYITRNFTTNVDASRRSIIILTKDYIKNGQCEMELYHLVHETCERDFGIIVVKLEDIPLKMIPKSLQRAFEERDVLEWNDANEQQKELFFEEMQKKLESRVPRRVNPS